MVSTQLPTLNSSSPFNNTLVTVSKAPITIGIIVIFMFHSFLNSLVKSRYLSFFSHCFNLILWSVGTEKSTILQVLFFFFLFFFFFLLIVIRAGLLAKIRWCWVVHIPFVRMVKFQFLAHFSYCHRRLYYCCCGGCCCCLYLVSSNQCLI